MFKQIFEIFKSDSLYEQALTECHEMLEIVREMFNESVKSLRNSDTAEIPVDIYAMDKKINAFERDVRRKVMTHLAVGGKEDIGSGLILNQAIDAFKQQDIDSARTLMTDYKKDISSISNEIVNAIVSGQNAEFSPDKAGALCLYARYLKRIAAHSRNLVSSIVNPFERIGYPE